MKCGLLLILLFLCLITDLRGQTKRTKILSFDTVYHAGINPAGELFVVSGNAVTRFDKDGNVLNKLVLAETNQLTSFDSWHLTQIVLYFRQQQRVEIYNHQLDFRHSFTIDSVFAIEPWLIAASYDQKYFWIYDKADNSLRKINPQTGEISVDAICQPIASSTLVFNLREYQRFLFLQTDSYFEIFNAIGKPIQHINSTSQPITFYGEEIVVIRDGTLEYIDLFTKERRTQLISQAYHYVLLTDERMFGISHRSVDILEIK